MTETSSKTRVAEKVATPKRRSSRMKPVWRAIREPLRNSRFAKAALVWSLAKAIRFIRMTNRRVDRIDELAESKKHAPAILALWHGQHLLAPTFYPKRYPLVAMISRSADAELNAQVFEKLGFEAVRGSGGRAGANNSEKGGATALIALKKALDAGKTVAMIADIPHGTPRDSGMGIVTLAKLSGRPILPIAVATSRRKVLEKSWDKTTINLPFGCSAVSLGEPIFVSQTATDAECEEARQAVTRGLDQATAEAYQLVDTVR